MAFFYKDFGPLGQFLKTRDLRKTAPKKARSDETKIDRLSKKMHFNFGFLNSKTPFGNFPFQILNSKKLAFYAVLFVAAFSMAGETFLLFGNRKGSFEYCLFVACSTLFVYLFQSIQLKKHIFGILSAVAAGLLFLKNEWPIFPDLAFSAVIAAFYFLPKKGNALRGFTFLKPISVTTVWAILSIRMPLVLMGQPFIFTLFAERFCFVAALAVGWDLVDFEKDLSQKLATLPVRFGVFWAKKAAFGLLVLATIFSVLLFARGFYSIKTLVAVGFSFAVSALVLEKKVAGKRVEISKIWLDSMMILQALAVAAALFLQF